VLQSLFGAAFFLSPGSRLMAAAEVPRRIVALDLPATDIAVFAGADLVGAAVASQYRSGRSDFVLDDIVADIGTTAEPNLELLYSLAPDLLVSAWPIPVPRVLSEIAPILNLQVFQAGLDRFQLFADAVAKVAANVSTVAPAGQSVADANNRLDVLARRLEPVSHGPVILANLNGDGIHLRALGPHSMCGAITVRLNVKNAFTGNDGIWGWRLMRPEELLASPDAWLIEVLQHWDGPALARRRLIDSPIWQQLPQVRSNRWVTLPPVALLGGLCSGMRFASSFAAALEERTR